MPTLLLSAPMPGRCKKARVRRNGRGGKTPVHFGAQGPRRGQGDSLMARVPDWGRDCQSVGCKARVAQLGGGHGVSLRPRAQKKPLVGQAAEGRKHRWKDRKQ